MFISFLPFYSKSIRSATAIIIDFSFQPFQGEREVQVSCTTYLFLAYF